MTDFDELRLSPELSHNTSVIAARKQLLQLPTCGPVNLRSLSLAYKHGESSRFQFKMKCKGSDDFIGSIVRSIGDGPDDVLDYLCIQVGRVAYEIAKHRSRRFEYTLYLQGIPRGVFREQNPYDQLFPWQKLMVTEHCWQVVWDDCLVGRVVIPRSVSARDVLQFEHVYGDSYPICFQSGFFLTPCRLLIPAETPEYSDSECSLLHLFVIGCVRFLLFDSPTGV